MAHRQGTDNTNNGRSGGKTPALDAPPLDALPVDALPVDALIEHFGGLRPMADRLGVPVSTVQGWKKRGAIPPARHADIRAFIARTENTAKTAAPPTTPTDTSKAGTDGKVEAAPNAPAVAAVENDKIVSHLETLTPTDTGITGTSPAVVSEQPPAAQAVAPKEDVTVTDKATETESAAVEPVKEASVDTASSAPAPTGSEPANTEPTHSEAVPETVPAPVVASSTDEAKPDATPAPVAPVVATAEPAPVAVAPAPASGGGATAIAAAVLAVIGAAVSVTAPMWSYDLLQQQTDYKNLESRTTTLEKSVGLGASHGTALGDRLSTAEKSLATLESRVAKVPAVTASLVVRDLRTALATGTPFTQELKSVQATGVLSSDNKALLGTLVPFADTGVPSRTEIADRFTQTAYDITGTSWLDFGGLMPTVTLPDMPNVSMPSMPSISMPDVSMPPMPQMPDMQQVTDLSSRMWNWVDGVINSVDFNQVAIALRLKDEPPAGTDAITQTPDEKAAEASAMPGSTPAETATINQAPPATSAPAAAAAQPPSAVETAPAAPVPVDTQTAAPSPAPVNDTKAETRRLLAQAGKLIRIGDLNGAVDIVATLPDPAAETAKPWLEAARARLAADRAIKGLADDVAKALQ